MTSQEIRQKFLAFFEKRGHQIIPSSSLIPDDSSVLLTTAGMQQFIPYLTGQVKPSYQRTCSIQKCFRVNDIDEVGDQTHHTFFEMLGNWSFGDPASSDGIGQGGYFKEGAIDYALEFLIKECHIPQEKLWVTIFKGEKGIPQDKEAFDWWVKKDIPSEKIFEFGLKDNFWGPVGPTGPCGPCSEIHYDSTEQACALGEQCGPNCSCGRFVEIWNLVFMEYDKDDQGKYQALPQKNIDTGIGFERLAAILQNKKSAYQTDLFEPIMEEIAVIAKGEALKQSRPLRRSFSEASPLRRSSSPRLRRVGAGSEASGESNEIALSFLASRNDTLAKSRIMADHLRGVCFLVADGVLPSNIEQGYVLRRILRRIIGQGKFWNLEKNFLIPLAKKVIELYQDVYPELHQKETDILTVIQKEEEKFGQTLEKGIKQFEKIAVKKDFKDKAPVKPGAETPCLNYLSGQEAFDLFSTYGLPLEMIKDLAVKKGLIVDEEGFEENRKKHQALSRAGAEKKFGGHGLGEVRIFSQEDEEKVKKLHTATHLLHQALEDVLGSEIQQRGSDISPERLRFDFNYSQKMTLEQIKQVEDLVNQKIKEDLPIKCQEMDKEEAIKSGAKAFFKDRYNQQIKVYSIDDYSKEICAGPHVEQTGQLGYFRIKKEQSSSTGVRRIRAVLE